MMQLSPRGERLIKSFEKLELEAYPDPASALGRETSKIGRPMRAYREVPDWRLYVGAPWTIGWGHTGGVGPGDRITEDGAQAFFDNDVRKFVDGVNALVKVPINQNQFDALVSFSFNVGLAALERSSLLRLLNANKSYLADSEFLKWNKANGTVMLGLVRRRKAERDLFIEPAGSIPA